LPIADFGFPIADFQSEPPDVGCYNFRNMGAMARNNAPRSLLSGLRPAEPRLGNSPTLESEGQNIGFAGERSCLMLVIADGCD